MVLVSPKKGPKKNRDREFSQPFLLVFNEYILTIFNLKRRETYII